MNGKPLHFKIKCLAHYKLNAGALQLSIYIAVIIALILVALMLYASTFLFLKEQSAAAIQNIRTADYAMAALLKEDQKITADTLKIIAEDDENKSLQTNLSHWGLFGKAYVTTVHRKKRFTKMAIVGSRMHPDVSPTLYLQDNYSPLSVVGNTLLSGTIYAPVLGVRPGYINGKGFYRENLTEGIVRQSTSSLPELDAQVSQAIDFYIQDNSGYISLQETPLGNKLNSFLKPVLKYHSNSVITFENTSITGNIIYKSDTLVRIKATAFLKDVIIIAPIIEVEQGVHGNFQAIASNKIVIGKDCKLNYPTALVLSKNNDPVVISGRNANHIFIGEGSKIFGAICYLQKSLDDNNYNTDVFINENVIIKGQLYCQGNLEVSGHISGSVFTKQFIVNRSGTKFLNYIFNTVIENKNVSECYGGIIFKNQKKTIMKWLY